MAMPFPDGAFDVVASALVIHFIPDRAKAFAEMKRVLASGGLVGGYTWKREGHEGVRRLCADDRRRRGHRRASRRTRRRSRKARSRACAPRSRPPGYTDADGDRDRGLADLREFRRILGNPDDPLPRAGKAVAKLSTRRGARGCAITCAKNCRRATAPSRIRRPRWPARRASLVDDLAAPRLPLKLPLALAVFLVIAYAGTATGASPACCSRSRSSTASRSSRARSRSWWRTRSIRW